LGITWYGVLERFSFAALSIFPAEEPTLFIALPAILLLSYSIFSPL
jgi:hypothetical protein